MNNTTTNKPFSTYRYKRAEIAVDKSYNRPSEPFAPSNLAVVIMGYRRQYRSQGIAHFAQEWLEPTLSRIVSSLTERGYTVAEQTLGTEYGYKNYCFDVSKDEQLSTTLYVAHYDTVDRDITQPTYKYENGKAIQVASNVAEPVYKTVLTDHNRAYLADDSDANCLGADDGAGLAVMLHLMNSGVIGGYCFTTGEECGGIGADEVLKVFPNYLTQYTRSIEIDRRGTSEIIYAQGVGDCASQTFTNWLCEKLDMGHKPSDLGSYTDVATFAEVIAENVNIASGYVEAHSSNEQVDLAYLDKLGERLVAVASELEQAPTERKAGDFGLQAYYGYDWTGYKASKGGYGLAEVGNQLDEAHYDMLLKLFVEDKGFLAYALEVGGVTDVEEMDYLLHDYYGYGLADFQSVMDVAEGR